MSNKESTSRTLMVALAVSLVSSVFVAGAAVSLKPLQQQNKLLDKQRSIAAIAGMGGAGLSGAQIRDLFGDTIKARLVDLETGAFVQEGPDPVTFDPLKAAKDPQQSVRLSKAEDIASIKRRERLTTVYVVEGDQGSIETLILPIRGYGLWSTLHGFMALKGDLNTVVGLGFYQHWAAKSTTRAGAASGRASACSMSRATSRSRWSRAAWIRRVRLPSIRSMRWRGRPSPVTASIIC